ncbi:uncharacterized protein LOC142621111 isoform X1 [Castanea sativa]|uniref:uncharacterized protein LOC142621111 isoform X1 n=1 Tax=Castanea sativa TaxID=21020 RepID=UPI003F64A608
MESARQRVRAATATKKKEQEKVRGELTPSSAPKLVGRTGAKRKPDGKDDRPGKKVATTPGDKSSKRPSPPRFVHGVGKGPMTSSGPITQGSVRRLLTHKDYVVEVTESILKDEEMDPYAEQAIDEIGASDLFDLTRAMVRMKALSNRCSAKEGVISHLHERIKYLADYQAQYKDANRILGTELKDLKEKLAEESR